MRSSRSPTRPRPRPTPKADGSGRVGTAISVLPTARCLVILAPSVLAAGFACLGERTGGRPVRTETDPAPMRPLLALLLVASLTACGSEADAPSTAGAFDEPAATTDDAPLPGVDEVGPDALGTSEASTTAAPEAAPTVAASGASTYDCVSGETITLEETDDGLRYTLADRTVLLAEESPGRYATEAMWVDVEADRVTVTRDEDSTLDCTAR